ncbi:hypothetical protein EDB85DRAFT_1889598 [Lactarius pseudohatsudake]|nr:hypothetical protein EDB85DRAFT_1889598 [Lactarius pseudohatsudake]
MDTSPSLLQVPRLRITRHPQLSLSPLDDDLSRTPTAGPSHLHALHGDNEDTDSTPRLPVSSSLPSIYAAVEDTPAARLRALLAQVPNTSSASRTQLLHEPPPPLPSDRDSDFDPPPKWANSSTTSSARENLRSLFTHALRDPGDTPRKDARRNSIDSSEVEDSPRIDRVIQERSRNKGKQTSFSDEELETSSKRNTPIPASHAANMEALRSRILGAHASQSDASMSVASDSSTDNAALIREMHGRTVPVPGISSTSLQTMHLSTQFQSQSILLDQDSEMQRAMGVGDSFGSTSTNQAPSFPQMAEPSIPARSRSSLVRAGSLTETKLTTNVLRQSEGTQVQRDRYDSVERPSKLANRVVGPHVAASNAGSVVGTVPSVPSTPPRERRDSYHHHRASHSLTGSPLPQEFPRQRNSPAQSGGSRSSSRTGSTSSLADFCEVRERMKDTEKERQHESRSRTTSNTGTTGHLGRPGLEQPRFTPDRGLRSREHSRPSSPSESVRSRTTEEAEENSEREHKWVSPHSTRNHQQQHRRPASPLPGPIISRVRTQSTQSKPNSSEIHTATQAQSRHVRRNPSHSSLTSEGSSCPSSPAEPDGTPPALVPRISWQFPRNRSRLPDFEPNITSPEHSPPPMHQSPIRNAGSTKPSHIPVRSPGRVPKVKLKQNGDAKEFTKGHKRATTEFAEANGAIPPRVRIQPLPGPELESASELENLGVKSPQESDESSTQDVLTPIARPIEVPPPDSEKLQSPPPAESLLAQAEHQSNPSSDASSLPTSPRLALSTPPRTPSVSTSRIGFRAPSPPEGLPELPGPPSEDDTGDNSFATRNNGGLLSLNLTTARTPRAPGAWAATPAPAPARSQTPQPILSSIGHSRTRSNSLPQPSFTEIQSSMATPASALTHAGTLPARTPAPPGGWFSTPGSLRRRSLMKVRFETTPSGSAVSDADADTTANDDKGVGASIPEASWDITPPIGPTHDTSESISEPSFNNVASSSPVLALSTSASGDGQNEDGPVANSPADPVDGAAAGSPSRRKLRRTPSVRLVDEYGRAKEDFPSTPSRKDVRDHSASMRMPGGGPLKTPRHASVRILDAMGHELEEPSEQNDSEDTVTEARYTRQEALDRMKKAVADLREGLNSVDISGNGSLDDPRLGELYDLSKAARDMRSKLASSLQQAQSAHVRHKYGSLKESMRKSRFLPNFLPESRAIPWNHWLFWGLLSLQFVVFLVMYRLSKIYAKHQFLTTYFDPFYADLHLHPTKPEFIYDTNLFSFLRRASMEPSLLERLGVDGPMYQLKRNIVDLVVQVQRYIWDSWGAGINDQVTAWPPT